MTTKDHDILCPYPGDMYDDYDCQCDLIRKVRDDEKAKSYTGPTQLPDAIMEQS